MSKVVIAGNASGTGVYTLEAPNGNTDRTLVLPDEAGTIITTAGVPASAMPAGSVIQVVHIDYSTPSSFTVPSNIEESVATGLTASITPVSTNSKIYVLCSANMSPTDTATVVKGLVQRTGDSTSNSTLSGSINNSSWSSVVYDDATNFMYPNTTILWLDSPNTTSQTTYTFRIGGNTPSAFVKLNEQQNYVGWGGVSYITLMEIAG